MLLLTLHSTLFLFASGPELCVRLKGLPCPLAVSGGLTEGTWAAVWEAQRREGGGHMRARVAPLPGSFSHVPSPNWPSPFKSLFWKPLPLLSFRPSSDNRSTIIKPGYRTTFCGSTLQTVPLCINPPGIILICERHLFPIGTVTDTGLIGLLVSKRRSQTKH